MTYFEDMTSYTYLNESSGDAMSAINVGWLDRAHTFQTGAAPEALIRGLAKLCGNPVNLTRGIHFCNLCRQLSPTEYRQRWNELTKFHSPYGDVMVGNGEIRVHGANGSLYAAPTLIIHYVACHKYLPPQDFIDGVVAAVE